MTPPQRASGFGRAMAVAGGLLFAASLAYFLVRYSAFGAVSGDWSPRGWLPVLGNTLLFAIFGAHHSVFARTGIKQLISARISPALERSTYVWVATVLFSATLWAWLPVPGSLWTLQGPPAWLFRACFAAGLLLTGVAAAALDPLELSGVRQAFGWPLRSDRELSTSGAYGVVRHPIYLGWVLMVWGMPVMTGTRLVFAVVSTVYLVVAIPLEERQMRRTSGGAYDAYARVVRWRLLPGIY